MSASLLPLLAAGQGRRPADHLATLTRLVRAGSVPLVLAALVALALA